LCDLRDEFPSHDLSSTLDERPSGDEYFIDDCHVTGGANAIVARKIFEGLIVSAGL
jgi:hypothetical protein